VTPAILQLSLLINPRYVLLLQDGNPTADIKESSYRCSAGPEHL